MINRKNPIYVRTKKNFLKTLKIHKFNSCQTLWSKYFNNLLKENVSEHEEIIVNVPNFIQNVDGLIAQTEKRYAVIR